MQTVEILRGEWQNYFDHLNKLYEGWAVTIEMLEGELGDQRATDGLPLQAINLETKGSACGDILVEAGDSEPALNTHHISRPRAVREVETRPGDEADIQIESDDGSVVLVRLRRLPELPPASSK